MLGSRHDLQIQFNRHGLVSKIKFREQVGNRGRRHSLAPLAVYINSQLLMAAARQWFGRVAGPT